MRRVRLAPLADTDLYEILIRSTADFGSAARLRYETLFGLALSTLSRDATPAGHRLIATSRRQFQTFHLRDVRQSGPETVKQPPHLLVYRMIGEDIRVERVLHERMNLVAHLDLIGR